MKKMIFIFLIIFGLSAYNITQATAGCNIVWSGFVSGSIPTNETSKTEQATHEAYHAICSTCASSICGVIEEGPCGYDYYCFDYKPRSLFVCSGGNYYWAYYEGSWDVVCDSTTTTTIQQSTITTTAPSTVIELSSFNAKPGNGSVTLSWSTETEIDNAGFNIYRATAENGEYEKTNSALIPAQGSSTQGTSYEFIDNGLQNRKTYYYKLEDIDLNSKATMHGPVSAIPRLIYGIGN